MFYPDEKIPAMPGFFCCLLVDYIMRAMISGFAL